MVTKWVNSILEKKMGQGIQEWNVQKLWKTAFKKFEMK